MKQPLGIVAIIYAGGLLLGNYFSLPLPCLFAISLALVAGTLLLPRLRSFFLWPLIFFTGWTNFAYHTAVISPYDLRLILSNQPELANLRGTLAQTPTKRFVINASGETFHTTARINVTAIQRDHHDWQPAFGQIEATANDLPPDFFTGQEVQIHGGVAPPPGPIAEGLFDFPTYLRRQEIYFQIKAKEDADWQLVSPQKISPPLSDRFKQWANAALTLGRPAVDDSLHLEQALTLGDKTFLTDQLTEPFVQAATYHIFAVDGLRMGIIFFIFFVSLRAARVPRLVCGATLIPIIWFYVALTGWPASAIRAAVMLTIVIAGWMLKRPSDLFNSLWTAAFLILLWQPQQLFQAGFQLSFVVVFCILLVTPAFDNFIQRLLKQDPLLPDDLRPHWQRVLIKPLRWFLGLFFSSLAAWVGSIPLVAYYFHILTPVSTLANVLAVPLCMGVLICNFTTLLLAGWLPAGATIANYFGWHLMNWIHSTSIWFAHLPHAYFYVSLPSVFTILVYYAILLAILSGWLFQAQRRPWKIASVILLSTIWLGIHLHETSATQITVLPLGNGSGIYCHAPGRQNDLLIDCGSRDSFEFVLKPYLRAQGVNSLPRLALTHGDENQIGAFEDLQSLIPIEKITTSSAQFRSPTYRRIIQSLDKTPARREVLNSGDSFSPWTVLNPTPTNHFPRADDNTLVLRGEVNGTRILLLSDLGKPGQTVLLETHTNLSAEIVVAGLPEQDEPLNDALLAAINPKLIIITDSEFPITKRASRTLRDRLEKHKIPTLYLSETSAIKLSLRPNQTKVETMANPHP